MKLAVPAMIAAIAAFAVISVVREGAGTAPTPEVFAGSTSLAAAVQESEATGKPVFAFFTAEWCGPCQSLKKNTLSDARVAGFLDEHTVPVYIDIDEDRAAATQFQISGIPTSIILQDRRVVARMTSYAGPDEYLEFLESGVKSN